MSIRRALAGIPTKSTRYSKVSYYGRPFAPTASTYVGIDSSALIFATHADTGVAINRRTSETRVLHPLIAAALFEVGFATEGGPLATWCN